MGKLTEKQIKIMKTCCIYLGDFSLGMCIAVAGPCLLDLQRIVNTDTEHIALMYTARSTGGIVGAILGGILLDFSKSKLAVMTICKVIIAATMFGIPWCRSFQNLLGLMIVNGLCLGGVEIGGNVLCIMLWGKKSGPFFQGLHFVFGLGGLLAPLIAAPFLSDYHLQGPITDNTGYLNDTLNSTSNFLFNGTDSSESLPTIVYPFSILGGLALLVAITLGTTCFISPTENGNIDKEDNRNSKRSLGFLVPIVIFNFLLIFVQAGMEIAYAQMLTTYAVKGRLRLHTITGSYMTSVFWASFTLSRLTSVFLAIKFTSLVLIVSDLIMTSVAGCILLFLMPREWALWLATVIYGIGVASFYPTAVGWLGTHIHVTNKIASVFTVGAATGEMVLPFLISYFIESIPEIFAYVLAGSCVSSALLVSIMYMIFRKIGKENVEEDPGRYAIRSLSLSMTA